MFHVIREVINMHPNNLHHKIITKQLGLLNASISFYEFALLKKMSTYTLPKTLSVQYIMAYFGSRCYPGRFTSGHSSTFSNE